MAPVIELGPGTGVFTRAIVERGIPEERISLVEFGAEFAEILRNRFPGAYIFQRDAAKLHKIIVLDANPAGAIISGLPLLWMPARKVYSILDGAFQHLREGGAFYQFTYGLRCPISKTILGRLDLKAVSIGWSFRNFPPAQVYRITRRRSKFALHASLKGANDSRFAAASASGTQPCQ